MIPTPMPLRPVLPAFVLQALPRYGDMTSGFSPPMTKPRQLRAQKASAPAAADQASGTAATDSQRLRSLISPWAYMSSKVDAIRVSLQRTVSRLSSLLITLQQSFPTIAQYFTEQALDSASYQGPLLDGSDVDTAA